MNDNFKTIYKILHILESNLDSEVINSEELSPKRLGVSPVRLGKYIQMLCESGYIAGVNISEYADGEKNIDISGIRITLKGLEYMKKAN